jgi:hypothetical protein
MTTSSTITGTARRNTDPHQKCSSSQPPTIGPRADPIAKPDAHRPMATRRRAGSGKVVRISERVEGIKVAPATPSIARAAISTAGLVAKAASVDATANPVAPMSRSRRRPMRSPRLPIVMSRPARTNA